MEGGKGEGRYRQMERGEGKREREGWKNVERKGNRIPPLLSSPEDNDWDKSSSAPSKSELMVEKKELSSEDTNRISQTIKLPHEKFTMSSSAPSKSELMVEKKELSSEDTNRISQTIKLPHEKFTMVSVGSVLSPGHYWVQSKDEEKDLISVMKIMNDMGKQAKKLLNLKAGDFCLAMFEGYPYRAKVLFVRNDEVEVFFVDFGNTDTCKLSNIGELPSDAWNYKSQAIEIVMAEQTPQKFLSLSENDVVSVKPICERNGKIVKVEGVKYEEIERPLKVVADDKIGRNSSEKVRMQWPKSVLGLVKEGMLVVCDVFDVMNEERAILGMAFEDVAEDLGTVFRDFPSKCSESILDETFKPKVGDLIAGTAGDENWLRGVVLSEESTGWMVAFCDAGSMCVVKNPQKMPDGVKYREAPAFAVQCTVLKSFLPKKDLYSENRIMISSKLHLKIVACNGEEVVADMLTKDKELFCKVKLEAWRPEVQSDLSCQILNNGDKVLIVSYFNTAAIFVQAADEVSQKKIQSLLQDVAGDCVDGKGKMNEAPSKGTLVSCKFSGDGNYYRALVMDVKEGNELFVSYVDFGNQEWAPLENVQRLSDELKKIPCYAIKIGLKVSGVSQLTGDAARLLNTLVLNSEELKIVIPDGDLRNCELVTKSGVSLNDKIVGLVDPSKSSITNAEGRIKWTSDMVGKLEIPESGSLSLKFLILHCPGKCTVVGCPAEDPRIEHVYKTFPAEMSEVCEKCPQVPYVPVAYELCMAKFTDGSWYRGFAADAKGDESLIYFVDFGNWMKVKHKDIRKMVPEFMKVPFIAILCTYKGFEEETISKEQENALKQYLKPNTLFLASISQEQGPDEYILDIPEVTQKLKSILP